MSVKTETIFQNIRMHEPYDITIVKSISFSFDSLTEKSESLQFLKRHFSLKYKQNGKVLPPNANTNLLINRLNLSLKTSCTTGQVCSMAG